MRPEPNPEGVKRRTQRLDFTLGAVALLIVALGAFQLFGRYQYVHTTGTKVVRIDRITGQNCVLPCQNADGGAYGPYYAAYAPEATPRPDKVCHTADVVRVAAEFSPPVDRTPTPYRKGGFRRRPGHRRRFNGPLDHAVELSDGHVYTFGQDAYGNDVSNWSTGQEVQVCATWSKLEQRPFYSVGSADEGNPATLAL